MFVAVVKPCRVTVTVWALSVKSTDAAGLKAIPDDNRRSGQNDRRQTRPVVHPRGPSFAPPASSAFWTTDNAAGAADTSNVLTVEMFKSASGDAISKPIRACR